MDPRHPELALPRVKELIKQYEDLEKRISKTTVSNKLGQLEGEGSLVVQEICLVAPRLHETLMNTSRSRRAELANGIVEKPAETESFVAKAAPEEAKALDKAVKEMEKKSAKKKAAKKGKK